MAFLVLKEMQFESVSRHFSRDADNKKFTSFEDWPKLVIYVEREIIKKSI